MRPASPTPPVSGPSATPMAPKAARSTSTKAARSALALLAGIVTAFGLLVALTTAAAAESPSDVAEEAAADGVFVGTGRSDIDEASLVAAVADAKTRGLDLIVVAPRDPQPSTKAFARRVQERTEAEAAIVFPMDGQAETYAIDELASARPRATDAARSLDDPAQAVAAFTDQLISDGDLGRPVIIGQILRALVLFAVVVGAVVLAETLIARSREATASAS